MIFGAALLAGPAAAGTTVTPSKAEVPPTAVEGLVVTAPEAAPRPRNLATDYIRARVPEGASHQYARFHTPICVRVEGLPEAFAGFISARVVSLARQVGAPVDPAADCTPNINVLFTTEPQALLAGVAKRRKLLLGYYGSPSELQRMMVFNRPIQSWYVTSTVDDTGTAYLELYDPTFFLHPLQGRAGSRFTNGMSARIVHSLILADASKVAGMKIDAVADYVAVLALSRWRGIFACSPTPTILNLMADDCEAGAATEAATPADLAVLSGLYATDPLAVGAVRRAAIAGRVRAAGAERAR